jgi:hypothetical protein
MFNTSQTLLYITLIRSKSGVYIFPYIPIRYIPYIYFKHCLKEFYSDWYTRLYCSSSISRYSITNDLEWQAAVRCIRIWRTITTLQNSFISILQRLIHQTFEINDIFMLQWKLFVFSTIFQYSNGHYRLILVASRNKTVL